jgi:long-chain-fatty-acid--[acyl-carrier-protein] ligase
MGLILNTMVPFYTRAALVLMEEGLHKVHSWLKTIERYKATFIAAPDIAYRLCVKSTRRPADYDLSSLRVALNASEPIHLKTYRMFEETFRLTNVMVSGYGLAEATVAVTMHPPNLPPMVDADGYVSSGKPLAGIEIIIEMDPASADQKSAGEILVKSPALMKRYFNVREGNNPFSGRGYLRTGDVGYLDPEGNLFVLARKKNIIIQAGHTLYPDDVEQAVQSSGEFRRVAAVGIELAPGSGENLVVFAESRWNENPSTGQFHEMAVEIVQRVYSNFGIKPGRVFIVKPKTLPFTPNGKLQHSVLKNEFLNHPEKFSKSILYPLL